MKGNKYYLQVLNHIYTWTAYDYRNTLVLIFFLSLRVNEYYKYVAMIWEKSVLYSRLYLMIIQRIDINKFWYIFYIWNQNCPKFYLV